MNNLLDFLKELKDNNNKEWFEAHRPQYVAVRKEFETFAAQLLEGLQSFDTSLQGLNLKDCFYRINRDTRFSNDKTPYKIHMGVYFAPHGKNSGYAGYYFHIEPQGSNYVGGNMMAAGNYFYEPKCLESIRTEIYDNPQQFIATLDTAKGFELSQDNKLKKVPRGFPADFEYGEYLKPRDYTLIKTISYKDILRDDLVDYVLAQFRLTQPFLQLINRSIEYARENMK